MESLRSSSSRSQMSFMSDNTVNKEEVSLVNVSPEKNWQDWKLSLVPQDKIYKKTTFSKLSFLSNYTIKTVERTFSLKQSFETIQLLSRQEIDKNIVLLTKSMSWINQSNLVERFNIYAWNMFKRTYIVEPHRNGKARWWDGCGEWTFKVDNMTTWLCLFQLPSFLEVLEDQPWIYLATIGFA